MRGFGTVGFSIFRHASHSTRFCLSRHSPPYQKSPQIELIMSKSKKKGKKGKDSKFFSSSTKKGEIREILDELCNPKLEVKRDAVKRVIALMTVGKDVSMLFPQVVNCMTTSKL